MIINQFLETRKIRRFQKLIIPNIRSNNKELLEHYDHENRYDSYQKYVCLRIS